MKSPLPKIIAMIVLLLVLPCAGGWRDSMAKILDDSRRLEKEPMVERFVKDGKTIARVTNVSSEPLVYSGESPVFPLVLIEEFQDGKWTSDRWSWCGGNVKRYPIPPGQSVDLRVNVSMDGKPTKVFSIFESGGKRALVLMYERK